MPVQKYMAANNTQHYDPHGRGARHTLFSGTTVLQAGTNNEDDVLAIVASTGTTWFSDSSLKVLCIHWRFLAVDVLLEITGPLGSICPIMGFSEAKLPESIVSFKS